MDPIRVNQIKVGNRERDFPPKKGHLKVPWEISYVSAYYMELFIGISLRVGERNIDSKENRV